MPGFRLARMRLLQSVGKFKTGNLGGDSAPSVRYCALGFEARRSIGLLLLCAALALSRQSWSEEHQPLELSASVLAARVDHHYNALHSLRVNFSQEYDGMGQHRRESGMLLLKKPGRMKWSYAHPPGKLFVLDGKDAYFYSPGQSEVQRVSAKKLDDLRSPLRFLLGHAELAKELQDLRITHHDEAYELTGVPRNMEQRVSSLQFTLAEDGTIQGIKIEEMDGSTSTFSFSDEQANPAATDADFSFHAPQGTVIVEGLPPS
ncbi:Outer membrane lipoprotein carrier protein LolA [Acidisarcina polymorpha]|uniref:Outer-membrane lipoprotein carrier protein n=1 Tax=Acidisarcina polymorpha TaxID=2211140 RepID=A0A2Z5G717_9BACT|nr:outer membrane lipoprotein chaperone LolA [Acidisarcina polymorpha]AXC14760.1 Outer membrane lipoprotein carrier protein LolA [Acidisarcina polymorpha]